jgi:hypothetical protein
MPNEQGVSNANSLIALHPQYLEGYKTSGSEIEHSVMHQLSLIVAGLDEGRGDITWLWT